MDRTFTTLLTKERKNTSIAPVKIASVITKNKTIDELLGYEYLLTNTRGGYSSGTIVGCNTRRYHGLLTGALDPPANRILALSNLLETVIIDGQLHHLSTFEFPGSGSEDNEKFSPAGYGYIECFTRGDGAHFDYRLDGIKMTKSIYLSRNDDTVLVQYDFKRVEKSFDFILRPFVALRDFHSLQKSYAPLCSAQLDGGLFICHDVPGSCELLISCQQMRGPKTQKRAFRGPLTYVKDPQWWFNFVFRADRSRRQDFLEDLWAPGFYKCTINGQGKIILKASLGNPCDTQQQSRTDIKAVITELKKAKQLVIAGAETKDQTIRTLTLAADQFICRRQTGRTTLLAGFPWFFDWGRDAFISLPGLLLATDRHEDARSVLTTFAAAADEGMIPNRFDDRSQTAYFNSIDASLWFINAAFQYLKASGDKATFTEQLLPVILQIIESYSSGTRFSICADTDGLITGGNEDTQLTWMDAKFGGTAFTPRHGKAVEVNALWYNALCKLSKFYADVDKEKANHFDKLAKDVSRSFIDLFWNDKTGYLNDCIYPDGTVDTSCRCNQILAVSLEFSPLTGEQQSRIVEVVRSEMLTPYGLRSLSPKDAKYKGSYSGTQYQRDESYHQGTVWAWLIGPFIEAYLKINGFSPQSRHKAREFVGPLVEHLTAQACLGSISEIFDGEPPHEPKGCFAQAWSIAELIRAIELINRQ